MSSLDLSSHKRRITLRLGALSKKSFYKKTAVFLGVIFAYQCVIFPFTLKASASYRDYDNNAVIYGGVLNLSELSSKITSGNDGKNNDLNKIFHTLGIFEEELPNGNIQGADMQTIEGYVTKQGQVYANGKLVSSNVISAGRTNLAGSTADVSGLPIFWRPPSVSFVPDKLDAFVHLVNGQFSWAVIKSCGNPIKNFGLPQISLQKWVRNISNGSGWVKEVNAKRGDEIEYKITYNVGPETLTNVSVYDALSGSLASQNNSSVSNREYLADPGNLTPSWLKWYPEGTSIVGYIAPRMLSWFAQGRAPYASGTATFRTTVKNDTPQNVTAILDDAAVYSDQTGVIISNPVIVRLAPNPLPQPDFTMSKQVKLKTSSGWSKIVSANPDDVLTYLITFNNIGETALQNVNVFDNLPPHVTYVSGSTVLYNDSNPSGKKLSDGITGSGVEIGDYKPGTNAKIEFSVKLLDNFPIGLTTLNNVACAQPEGLGEICDKATTKITILGTPKIERSKIALNITQGKVDAQKVKANSGDIIEYTLFTKNSGSAAENNFAITEDINDILIYGDVTDTGGATFNKEKGILDYGKANIAVGQTIIKKFKIKVKKQIPVAQNHLSTANYMIWL